MLWEKLEETHDVIKVGNHVTDLETAGDVIVSGANITLNARKVLLDNGTYISKGKYIDNKFQIRIDAG